MQFLIMLLPGDGISKAQCSSSRATWIGVLICRPRSGLGSSSSDLQIMEKIRFVFEDEEVRLVTFRVVPAGTSSRSECFIEHILLLSWTIS